MLIEALEKRFDRVEGMPSTRTLEVFTDNGGAYIATETQQIVPQLGLKPVNMPVCNLQSNGLAESFVTTFKRGYVSRVDLTDAMTVMAQMATPFEHFNEVQPHTALKMKSPREFRQHRTAQQRLAQSGQSLHCQDSLS